MVTRTYQLFVSFGASSSANLNIVRKGFIVGYTINHISNAVAASSSVVEVSTTPTIQSGVVDAQGVIAHSELYVAAGGAPACSNWSFGNLAYPVEQGQKIYLFGAGNAGNLGQATVILHVAE